MTVKTLGVFEGQKPIELPGDRVGAAIADGRVESKADLYVSKVDAVAKCELVSYPIRLGEFWGANPCSLFVSRYKGVLSQEGF